MEWNIKGKDIVNWLVGLVPLLIFYLEYRSNKKASKESEKKLLQELEKRVRAEEEIKRWKQLYSWAKTDADKYSKESEEFETKFWQLRFILSWYGFKQEDIEKIIDGSVSEMEWEERLEIQKLKGEITKRKFKCSRCDKCNKEKSVKSAY